MSGREIEKAQAGNKKKYGLSGDQFCVYVANRFVIPSLKHEQLVKFTHGEHTLDQLTKMYIHNNFEYEFIVVSTSKEAYQLETKARSGLVFSSKPLLNPAQNAN